MEIIIICLLIGVIVIQQFLHYKIVKDLTLKIKANPKEYWQMTQKPEEEPEEEELIPPEEADPDDYLKALKKQ